MNVRGPAGRRAVPFILTLWAYNENRADCSQLEVNSMLPLAASGGSSQEAGRMGGCECTFSPSERDDGWNRCCGGQCTLSPLTVSISCHDHLSPQAPSNNAPSVYIIHPSSASGTL